MGLLGRFRAALDGVLAPATDPRAPAPAPYARQLELLEELRRALVEVTTVRGRLEVGAQQRAAQLSALQAAAQHEVLLDREDAARLILRRRRLLVHEQARIETHIAHTVEQEQALLLTEQRLAEQVATLRRRWQSSQVQRHAAEARVRSGERLSDLSGELADLSNLLQQAEAEATSLQVHADSLDELVQRATLAGTAGDTFAGFELDQAVESELAALRAHRARKAPFR